MWWSGKADAEGLWNRLKQYTDSNAYPFHMPGHKRNLSLIDDFYRIDITEIDGFDDLHHAQGVLKEGMEHLACAVGARKSYYLVNGSTCGILSSIYASCKDGGVIAAARNCHRSVAHGILLKRLRPVFIYPQLVDKLWINRGITAKEVEKLYDNNADISAVILTSPTYEGVVSDISEIAEIVHRHNGLFIVDEAHGAHLPYGEAGILPPSAITQGADIVIQSLHKNLPALTQSAALHICSDRVEAGKLERALRIFETSSPSYVMMAGMDACVRYMEADGRSRLLWLCHRLELFYKRAKSWERLVFFSEDMCCCVEEQKKKVCRDKTRVVFGARERAGGKVASIGRLLHERLARVYHLQPEMSTPEYVVLIMTVGDTEEGFERLEKALEQINGWLAGIVCGRDEEPGRAELFSALGTEAAVCMSPWEALEAKSERIPVTESEGRIAAEMAYIYPPGSPFVMPGEQIGSAQLEIWKHYRECNMDLMGLEDETGDTIRVVKE